MNGSTRTEPWTARTRQEPGQAPRGPVMLLRLGVWSVLHFVFYFLQQIAELLAPLLLVAGIGWWALPRIVAAVTAGAGSDAQAHDLLNTISGTIPASLHLGHHVFTPYGLMVDGLLLMAVAAIGATLSAIAARGM